LVQERRDYIKKRLIADGSIKVSELSSFFNVSTETIRKDLICLEQDGVAKKEYGGAVALQNAFEPSFKLKAVTHLEEKTRIANEALKRIESGMSLILDAGSTVFALAKALAIRRDITVFTNGFNTAQVLDEYGITTYVLGGRIRTNSNAIVGNWALRNLQEIKVDLAILGTSGFAGRQGPCVEGFSEAALKTAMIESGSKVIVLGDASKAKKQAVVEFAKWKDVDELITDSRIEQDTLDMIRKQTSVTIV
jgi:DeoR/GlpR family transcriptional regulator of sugar metabolism